MVSCVKPLAVIFLDMDGVMSDRMNPKESSKIDKAYQEIQAANPIYSDRSSMSKGKAYNLLSRRAQAKCLSPDALENLSSLIERVSATMQVAIVISSAWRDEVSLDALQNHIFADCFFRDLIIDKIPDDESTYDRLKYFNKLASDFKTPSQICNEKYGFELKDSRGRQIDFWLKENRAERNIYSYVVIDDNVGYSEIWKYHPDRFVNVNPSKLFSKKDADLAYDILSTEWSRGELGNECSMQTTLDS